MSRPKQPTTAIKQEPQSSMQNARDALERKQALGECRQKNPVEKLADKPTSLRAAVNAKCFECNGEDADPCWKWRVGNCDIFGCGLWGVRPYRKMYRGPVPAALLRLGWGK